MLKHADLIAGYQTYPHSDLRETGRRAARAMLRTLSTDAAPRAVSCKLPMIVPTETSQHSAFPMREVWQRLAAVEERTGLPASCFCPHPWLDAPDSTVVLLAYAPPDQCAETGQALQVAAQELWNSKDELYSPMAGLAQVWQEIESARSRPALLVDSGDVVLAGAPGDSTTVLRFLMESDTSLRCLLHITDPVAAKRLATETLAGVVSMAVGAGLAPAFYKPVELSGELTTCSTAPYTAKGDYARGMLVDAGARAVVRTGNHTVVVTEKPDPAHDPEFFRSLGIAPESHDVIVVKSHNTFRPAYRDISETVFRAATPGVTSPDLSSLPYRHGPQLLHPLAPVDPDFQVTIGVG